jgi:hypothetical protein
MRCGSRRRCKSIGGRLAGISGDVEGNNPYRFSSTGMDSLSRVPLLAHVQLLI